MGPGASVWLATNVLRHSRVSKLHGTVCGSTLLSCGAPFGGKLGGRARRPCAGTLPGCICVKACQRPDSSQVFILDALSAYTPKDGKEAEETIERVTPRLQHANCAVVLSAVKARCDSAKLLAC